MGDTAHGRARWRGYAATETFVDLLPLTRRTEPSTSADAAVPEAQPADVARRRDAFYRRLLGVADILSAAIAVCIGVPLLGGDALTWAALLAAPLVVVVSKLSGLYDRDEHVVHKSTLDEAPALFRVATLYTLLAWLAEGWLIEGQFGHVQVLALWALLLMQMLITRAVVRRLARACTPQERCMVLGDDAAATLMRDKLARCPGTKALVVGYVALEGQDTGEHRTATVAGKNGLAVIDGDEHPTMLGDFEGLGDVLARHEIDRVIIAPSTSDSDHILDAVRTVKALGVKVSVLPRLFEVIGSSVEYDDIDGTTLLGLRPYGLSRSSELVKRGLDVVVTATGLLTIAPLLAMISIAIKLTSPGPVFFRQQRMGRGSVPFDMLKFRTMVDGADEQKAALMDRNQAGGGLFKIDGDPRITRVGRYLRASSLDELPQLFNVLRGDMALVGPRPLVVDEDQRIEGWQRRRLMLPPGMTGLWQIFGSARIPMPEMVKIDYFYGANWSLWLDIKILLRTVPFVLGRRGL